MNADYIFKLSNKLEQYDKMQDFAQVVIIFSEKFTQFNYNWAIMLGSIYTKSLWNHSFGQENIKILPLVSVTLYYLYCITLPN